MAEINPVNGNAVVLRLIFFILTALFVVMTGIGGWTASHLMDSVDSIHNDVSSLKTDVAVEKATQAQRDIRLTNIENYLYSNQNKLPQKTR